MTGAHSVSSSVEVAADSLTAFTVFTEEVGLWWVQGPINFYDSSKAYGRRFEPGVGGRVLEVYDDRTGEGLELGRITVWEPGARLAWKSSRDDVSVDVQFEKTGAGTTVTVEATVAEGGQDLGATSWVRVTPLWFGDWCAKRDDVPHEPLRLSRLAVAIRYEHPAAAAQWLRDVFGFAPAGVLPEVDPPADHTWIEFHVGDAALIVFGRTDGGSGGSVTHTPWVFVDDLDAHYARTRQRGAIIVEEIWEHGVRAYEAADLEGNHWTFAQASPRMRS
jgi:uncharacterized glyoxalase superfamily protein PhnB